MWNVDLPVIFACILLSYRFVVSFLLCVTVGTAGSFQIDRLIN
jgi:hypothetical protein